MYPAPPPQPFRPGTYQNRKRGTYATSPGPLTREEVALYDPPPGWDAAKQAAHERAWRQASRAGQTTQTQTEETLTSAEEWRERFRKMKGEVK